MTYRGRPGAVLRGTQILTLIQEMEDTNKTRLEIVEETRAICMVVDSLYATVMGDNTVLYATHGAALTKAVKDVRLHAANILATAHDIEN